jgi:hypothetical protein
MKNILRKWVIGTLATGCMLAVIACEQQPAGQTQSKANTPNFGAIADMEGGDKEDAKKTETQAGQTASGKSAASTSGAESTQK